MSRTMKTGALLAVLWAAPALAGPGNGIRFGGSDGRLHPYLELEGRYDSNVFLDDTGASKAAWVVHVRPGLKLDVPGEFAKVFFDGQLDWAQYLGSGLPSNLSQLFGNAAVGVRVNERGAVGLDFKDEFRRLNWTPSLSLGSAVIADYNTLSASVPWTPGGGALVLTTGADWTLETFEPYFSGDPARLSRWGYNELRAGEGIAWRFLPRTSAVLDASFFDRIPNSTEVSSTVRGVRVIAGATGLVTPHFSGTLEGGWGTTLQATDVPTFSTWLAKVEGEWIGNDLLRARAGYEHDLGSDPGKEFAVYQSHRVFAEARAATVGRIELRLRAEWQRRQYEAIAAVGALGGDIDYVRVEPAVDAELARWFRLGAAYGYTKRTAAGTLVGPSSPGYDYAKSEAWLRATFTY